jgi:hypothetical protein
LDILRYSGIREVWLRRLRAVASPLFSSDRTKTGLWANSIVSFLVAIFCVAALSGCGRDEVYKWRQKMTVEVDTPNGVVTGSNVVEVTWIIGSFRPGDGPGVAFKVKGEAIALDIRPGQKLFVLISTAEYTASALYHGPTRGLGTPEGAADILKQPLNQPVELPVDSYPKLVVFQNIDDPKSIRVLKHDELAEEFGPGVAVRSVKFELTEAPVSPSQIGAVLNWLPSDSEASICPGEDPVNPPLCADFLERYFRRYY